jgi:hypothetical protein
VELAVATSTAPAAWAAEDDWTIATAVAVLAEQAAAVKAKGRR